MTPLGRAPGVIDNPYVTDLIEHEEAGCLVGGITRAVEVALYMLVLSGHVRIVPGGLIELADDSPVDDSPVDGPVQPAIMAALRNDRSILGTDLFTLLGHSERARSLEARLIADGLRRPYREEPTRAGRRLLDAYRRAHGDDPVAAVALTGWTAVPDPEIRGPLLVDRMHASRRAAQSASRKGLAGAAGETGVDTWSAGGGLP